MSRQEGKLRTDYALLSPFNHDELSNSICYHLHFVRLTVLPSLICSHNEFLLLYSSIANKRIINVKEKPGKLKKAKKKKKGIKGRLERYLPDSYVFQPTCGFHLLPQLMKATVLAKSSCFYILFLVSLSSTANLSGCRSFLPFLTYFFDKRIRIS